MDTQAKTHRSQAFFNRFNLSLYDLVVNFVSPFAWRCPMSYLDARYRQYLSNNHLEVGPGTGFLLNRAHFSAANPRVVLMDLSQACLDKSSERLGRFNPATCRQNILESVSQPLEKFDSIAINYVLHCVPGSFKEKGVAFANLKPLLNDGGVIFGCSVLGKDVEKNWLAKLALGFLQGTGIFHNQQDCLEELRQALEANFTDVQIEMRGPTAVFSARYFSNS